MMNIIVHNMNKKITIPTLYYEYFHIFITLGNKTS